MSFAKERIWIIGASTGIGRALAEQLAAQGARLVLSARDREELNALAHELPGQRHQVLALDVSKHEQLEQVAETLKGDWPQRIIFMAAVYQPSAAADMKIHDIQTMVQVNLMGAFHLIDVVLPSLYEKGGQLALCGSVAGYMGLPKGQPYSATKAALINVAESLYAEAPKGVDIKLINPGFVKTRMTDKNDFTMPCRISPEKAAKVIAKGLHKGAFEITMPKRFTWTLKAIAHLPYALKLPLLRKMVG